MIQTLNTKVEILEVQESKNYGKFSMSPLERGYGTTLGNSLRRVLLSSLPGTAIASIKFDEGVPHEFTIVQGMLEDVPELVLNLKGVAMKRTGGEGETLRLRLDVQGPKIVTAGDITETSDIEIVNRDHYLCTVNKEGEIHLELTVVDGSGFAVAEKNKGEHDPIGTIVIDSSFTPVVKVNYSVENTRVEQATDFDRLTLEVWTNGTISPQEAVAKGSQILIDHFDLFTTLPEAILDEPEEEPVTEETEEVEEDQIYNKPIEDLDLSLRSYNCLKRAEINTVGDIVTKDLQELSKIRNFGKKSFAEVEEKITALGLEIKESAE